MSQKLEKNRLEMLIHRNKGCNPRDNHGNQRRVRTQLPTIENQKGARDLLVE